MPVPVPELRQRQWHMVSQLIFGLPLDVVTPTADEAIQPGDRSHRDKHWEYLIRLVIQIGGVQNDINTHSTYRVSQWPADRKFRIWSCSLRLFDRGQKNFLDLIVQCYCIPVGDRANFGQEGYANPVRKSSKKNICDLLPFIETKQPATSNLFPWLQRLPFTPDQDTLGRESLGQSLAPIT